tara:strand:+ start:41 stop:295 length:255 start_codon:yes stop_codon:yes gene_type:complete
MKFYVYLLITNIKNKKITYVGYTKNLNKRLLNHNKSRGAKFTRGKQWKMIYSKAYDSKIEAMREEYKLKKNYLLRKKIKEGYKI